MNPDPQSRDSASVKPLSVAVVGHTNAGKTSLMRTLLRDRRFGEVADAAGTTRHVEGAALLIEDEVAIRLYDTPGMEDSIGLLEVLETTTAAADPPVAEGPDQLRYFLSHGHQHPDFEQEQKVLRQILRSELLLYVIDVREPILAKYRDELTLLSLADRPIIPVLNFTRHPRALTDGWMQQLARMQMHATVAFDNVVFRFSDELKLLQKMQSLMNAHWDALQRLIDYRTRVWNQQMESAARTLARTFVEAAALRKVAAPGTDDLSHEVTALQQEARALEQQCLQALLRRFGFDANDVRLETLAVRQDQWRRDLFDKAQLRRFGAEAGSSAAKGAAVGAGVDLVVGGMSLGAASALGAMAGMLVSAGRRFGSEVKARLRNQQILCLDEATLNHLWSRQLTLLARLQARGHAAQTPAQLEESGFALPSESRAWMRQARSNPDWYPAPEHFAAAEPDADRDALIAEIARTILQILQESFHGQT